LERSGDLVIGEGKGFCRRFARMNADQEKQTHRGGAENSDSFDGLNGHSIDFTRSSNPRRRRFNAAIEVVSPLIEGARDS